ncbi:acyltransferase family protein [Arthrobacter psychrolactophilus]
MSSILASSTDTGTTTRLYGLDILRGIAIFLVLLRHAWPEYFGTAGIVGVVMFFALSGYLITSLLDRDISANGRVRYGRFYLHRAFRLIPALAFMLAGFAVIEGAWNILGDRPKILRSVIVGMTYTTNIPGFDHGSTALGHLWTLATEEQFYLVWPVVLFAAIKWSRVRTATWACIFGATLACAASIFLAGSTPERVYTLPTSWCVAMLIGALAYLEREALSRVFTIEKVPRHLVRGISLVALAFISLLPEMKAWPGTYLIVGPAIALLTVVLVFDFKRFNGPAPRFARPLLALGTISYAAYLWNKPMVSWLGDSPLGLVNGIASIVLTLLAATISWWLVERPMVSLRRRFDSRHAKTKRL